MILWLNDVGNVWQNPQGNDFPSTLQIVTNKQLAKEYNDTKDTKVPSSKSNVLRLSVDCSNLHSWRQQFQAILTLKYQYHAQLSSLTYVMFSGSAVFNSSKNGIKGCFRKYGIMTQSTSGIEGVQIFGQTHMSYWWLSLIIYPISVIWKSQENSLKLESVWKSPIFQLRIYFSIITESYASYIHLQVSQKMGVLLKLSMLFSDFPLFSLVNTWCGAFLDFVHFHPAIVVPLFLETAQPFLPRPPVGPWNQSPRSSVEIPERARTWLKGTYPLVN